MPIVSATGAERSCCVSGGVQTGVMDAFAIAATAVACLLLGLWLGFTLARRTKSDSALEGQVSLLTAQLNDRQGSAEQVAGLNAALEDIRRQVKAFNEQSQSSAQARAKSEGELQTLLNRVAATNANLQQETAKLATTLTRSQDRGAWGQDSLETQLVSAGFVKGVHFSTQASVGTEEGNRRPDFLIALPDGASLVADAKFPMAAYLQAEKVEEAARPELLKRHAKEVLEHAKALNKKHYAENFEGPSFVVMYLPFESLWSEAMRAEPGLLKQCLDLQIVPVTPSTVFPLVSLVLHLWQQSKLEQEAHALAGQATKFVDRLVKMSTELNRLGSQLNTAANTFNDFVRYFNNSFIRDAARLRDHGVVFNQSLTAATETPAEFQPAKDLEGVIDIEPADELAGGDE